VLVTDDRKEDWWWISHGKTVGPRRELVEEMRSVAGVPFYMYRPESLLVEAGKRSLVSEFASAGTVDEIQDLGSIENALPARKSQLDLLRVLAVEVWGERGVERLEAAADKPLGRISRADADGWLDALTEDQWSSLGNFAAHGEAASPAHPGEIPYPELRRAGVPLSGYTDRLLQDLRSRSFDRQNNAANALSNATRKGELWALPTALQEDLGRRLLAAADGVGGYGSFGAQKLLGTIRLSPGGWPEGFVAGLLIGALIDEDGRFDVKAAHADDALKTTVSHPAADVVLARVEQEVGASHTLEVSSVFVTENGDFDDFEFAARMIEEAKEDAPERAPSLDALAAAVRGASPREADGPE